MDVLISGAGIAGLTAAHWLRRYGFTPTVVERAHWKYYAGPGSTRRSKTRRLTWRALSSSTAMARLSTG